MQQIYRRTPMQKCDYSKAALQRHCGMGATTLLLSICCIFLKYYFQEHLWRAASGNGSEDAVNGNEELIR